MGEVYYRGVRKEDGTTEVVKVDAAGVESPLRPRLDLRNSSPTGLEWGYGGSGPSQLALAILADALSDDLAIGYHERYEQFKWDVIARIQTDEWEIPAATIVEWAAARPL